MSDPVSPDALAVAARAVAQNAYAPYSKFRVGAALETDDGRVFTGANIENASYGLGRCAEQSAIQAMASAGARRFKRIHVYSESSPPASPCGACRQILYEFGPDAVVVCSNHLNETLSSTVRELLPGAFGPEFLLEP